MLAYFSVTASPLRGEVRLVGAQIRGQLSCSNVRFSNLSGYALNAAGVNVAGDVMLSGGFVATGEVTMSGAQIGGGLDCTIAMFKNPKSGALTVERAKVRSGVVLGAGFGAEGTVNFVAAEIAGPLILKGACLSKATLLLEGASAEGLVDDEQSWPQTGNLHLDGFRYSRIAAGPTDSASRLKWLRRQLPANKERRRGHFRPQPYRELATTLREQGHEREAVEILVGLENDRRKYGELSFSSRIWASVLHLTIGYGYHPLLALGWIFGMVLLGYILFGAGYRVGVVRPTNPTAYSEFLKHQSPGESYEPFCAVIYSLDTFLAVINLAQKDHWLLDPRAPISVPPIQQPRRYTSHAHFTRLFLARTKMDCRASDRPARFPQWSRDSVASF